MIKKYFNRFYFEKFSAVLVFVIIIFFLVYKVGQIPAGIFCDEAEIANISFELSQGRAGTYYVKPFFYRHFNYIYGYLPIVTTAPFLFFGITEFATRFVSVFYSFLGLFFIFLTLK